ncbi:MAG: hypothetical protein IJ808_05435 [Muribaculaceae bacterium]|nr:hypothetical protein [Muribaculaceae bacterium]
MEMSNRVIAQNEEFVLTGDSLAEGSLAVWSADGLHLESNFIPAALQWALENRGDSTLRLSLGSTWEGATHEIEPRFNSGEPLLDALWQMSLDHIAGSESLAGGFNTYDDRSSTLCSIYLSLATLNPSLAKTTLRRMVKDGIVVQSDGTWPVCLDRLAWATAAWEIYVATGDKTWLQYALNVTEATIAQDFDVMMDTHAGLLRGGRLAPYLSGDFYAPCMDAQDVAASINLSVNAIALHALEVADKMQEELDIEPTHGEAITHLRDAINQRLWNESRGSYAGYCHEMSWPANAPVADNRAQAFAVLWDLASDDRAQTLIARTPTTHRGITAFFPTFKVTEPCLEYTSWAQVQALWNIAAAEVGNEHALRRGWAALMRSQVLYQRLHATLQGQQVNYLGTSASEAAMVLRVLFGLNFTPEGIEFHPLVPACLPSNKTLLGFRYRDAQLDFTITGTGRSLRRVSLDGTPLEGGFLPGDIKGHHNVLIEMQESTGATQQVTLSRSSRPLMARQLPWPHDSVAAVQFTDSIMSDTLSATFTLEHSGKYWLVADYQTLLGCTVMTVDANGHRQGTLVLPRTHGDSTRHSIPLRVDLLKGDNEITIKLYRSVNRQSTIISRMQLHRHSP